MEPHWYVIHTFSGQEARAKQALLERARLNHLAMLGEYRSSMETS